MGDNFRNIEHKGIDDNVISFISIAKSCIYDNAGNCIDGFKVNWNYIYKTAVRNNMAGILYPAITKTKQIDDIHPDLLKVWKDETLINSFLEYKKLTAIRGLLAEAEKEGIRLVFLKGCIIADLYPKYELRNTSDTDIFIYERDREKIVKLLEQAGYIKDEVNSKEQVLVYVQSKISHIVELHFCLWEDYKGKRVDILKEINLTNEDSLIEVEACGLKVTTLGYNEHLIFQMFHIIKHFAMEAVGIRYLTDITLYLNRYGEYIDCSHFWEQMNRLGFARFCYVFFQLCIRYFGMRKDIIQAIQSVDNNGEEELLLDIINMGVIFENRSAPWQIFELMTPYLFGGEIIHDTKIRRKLKILFPFHKALPEKFSFAKKNKVLLPVVWIYNALYFVIRFKTPRKHHDDWYTSREKLTVVDNRLKLMKNLGLVEKV